MDIEDKYSFQLSEQCIALLDEDRTAFYALLRDELIQHIGDIEWFLPRYCTEFREDYVDGQVNIPDYDITVDDNGVGSFYINFYGFVCMGCKDMDHEEEHVDRFNYSIDKNTRVITIDFPFPPEREPDEY